MYKYILTALTVMILAGCTGDSDEIKAPGATAESDTIAVIRPDTQIRGAKIFLYHGSTITTDINADYIEKYEKQDSTLAWKLDVHFFNDSGKETSSLTSDSGLIREHLNLMNAYGNVVAVNNEGARLETEELIYNGNTEMITSDSFVTIFQNGDTLRGYGMESDKEMKRIRILRKVSGAIQNVDDFGEE